MDKGSLMAISKKLIEYIDESVGHDGDKLYDILSNKIGMTDNEIDDIVWQRGE